MGAVAEIVCARCRETKPASAEHFNRNPNTRHGFQTVCKPCRSDYERARYIEKRKEIAAVRRKYQEEHRDELAAKRRARYREQKEANPLAVAASYHANYMKNREARLAKCAEYRATHRDELRAYFRQRYQANKVEILAECKRRYEENPAAWRVYGRARKARVRNATGRHTVADEKAQLERQRGRCFWCEKRVTEYHVDHVVPLSLGGSNGPENLVVSCPACNLSKHAKHPMDFAGVMF